MRIVWGECERVGYGEEIIGQDFASRLCGAWCALRRWASAEHVKRWSTEMGSSLLQKEQFSGWRSEAR